MRKYKVHFIALLILTSCGICPEPNYIYFDKDVQSIETESEEFFIQQVNIVQQIRNGSSVQDSILVTIKSLGEGKRQINLRNIDNIYQVEGNLSNWIGKNVHYNVQIKKYEQFEKSPDDFENEDRIMFGTGDNDRKREMYNSKHPCP